LQDSFNKKVSTKHKIIRKQADLLYQVYKKQVYYEEDSTNNLTFKELKEVDIVIPNKKINNKKINNKILGLTYRSLKKTQESIFETYIKKLKKKKSKKILFSQKINNYE